MDKIRLVAPWGEAVTIFGDRGSPIRLAEGGLIGVGPSRKVPTVNILGAVGDTARLDRSVLDPGDGTLKLNVYSDRDGSAWHHASRVASMVEHTRYSQLIMVAGGVEYSADIRLKDGGRVDVPATDGLDFYQVSVPFVMDRSGWGRDHEGTGTVAVKNDGLDTVFPSVEWSGTGSLTLPSGKTIALPNVGGARILSLDKRDWCMVYTPDGAKDRDMWRKLYSQVGPEGVPPGETRTFTTTGTMRWRVGVKETWT